MKRTILITVLSPMLVLFAAQNVRADVSLSIALGDPGYYGAVVIDGYYPRPRLVYRDPVVIGHSHRYAHPVYLNVPPSHARNWKKHCGRYDACYRPVYFVQNSWYDDVYVHSYHEHHGKKGKRKGKHKHKHGHSH